MSPAVAQDSGTAPSSAARAPPRETKRRRHQHCPARPPGLPRRLPGQWLGLRATPLSGAQLSPSDRLHPLPVPGSPFTRSPGSSLSVHLSWRATSGHRLGWMRGSCPCVQGSCFRSWSCSSSTQVSDIGRRDQGKGLGLRLGHIPDDAVWVGLTRTFVAAQRSCGPGGARNPRLDLYTVLFRSSPLTFPFSSVFFSFLSPQSNVETSIPHLGN